MKKIKLIALCSLMAFGVGGAIVSCGPKNDNTGDVGGDTQQEDVGLEVSLSEVSLNVGEDKVVTAKTKNDEEYLISWESSNKEIATVKKGTIHAVKEGTCEIKVSARKKGTIKVLQSKKISVTVSNFTITLNETEVTISMSEGKTHQLTAKQSGFEGALKWSSGDEKVATVSETGLVTAQRSGETIITVTNGKASATCKVKVFANFFSLDDKAEVKLNEEVTINVKGTPANDAVWSVEDTTIASVKDGKVTGLKVGMTTITLSSETDKISSSCVIIVKGTDEEVADLATGVKADAVNNPGSWYYLCENEQNVLVESTPTIDNGLIHANVTRVGDADGNIKGANFFYLRYQPDAVGGIIYKTTFFIYSKTESLLSINGGTDTTYKAGLNKVEFDYTSASKDDPSPVQIKFKSTGDFYIIPLFEKTGEVKKMTLSESAKELDLNGVKEFTLTANVPDTENPTVEWSSNNEAVASVENGKVTAKSIGSAVITAVSGSYSATCTVSVVNSAVVDDRVDLEKGKNADVIANKEKWYYFQDDKAKSTFRKIKDNVIDFDITNNVNSKGDKTQFSYLRYAPQDGTYDCKYSIKFIGGDESTSILPSCSGNALNEQTITVKSGETKEGTFEFTMDATKNAPFQFKFSALGTYQFTITFAKK